MGTQLLHIFRNTPLGRETLLQSIYFCSLTRSALTIYIPQFTKFLMYFDSQVVQVDLDDSYLSHPETAKTHAIDLLEKSGIDPVFFTPKNFTASTLPDLPVNFDYMCCPRSISDASAKIGLGYIGSRVRRIIKTAPFPVLISGPVYKPWKSITVFFGGSANSIKALKLGLDLARKTKMPLQIFTFMDTKTTQDSCKERIRSEGLQNDVDKYIHKWDFYSEGSFEENLYAIPHDALVVLGAYGHGLIKDFFFGSKMEIIQSTLTNTLLVAGPNQILR